MDYSSLATTYKHLEETSSRLEKTDIITQLLKETAQEDLPHITLLLQGRVYPQYAEQNIGIASQSVIAALHQSTGLTEKEINNRWKDTGDLGDVAAEIINKKQQSTLAGEKLTIQRVFKQIKKLAEN